MSLHRGSVAFEPKARIIKLLGDELITDEVIAVVELVKNSYDADATRVNIVLDNVTDFENGRIVISDDGVGMDLDTVLGAWMQPGTDYRKKSRDKNERSKKLHRPILGEKGVGRFAAQKLGSLITLTTKSKNDELETIVEIDWKEFEKDKLLSDILVKWIQIEPKTFRGSLTGTCIEMCSLRKQWTETMVSRLIEKLGSLQSPFREKENFEITLESKEFPELAKEIQFPVDLFKRALYSSSGTISGEGIINASYHFCNPSYRKLERNITVKDKDVRDPDYFKSDNARRRPVGGGFRFSFYVWDLDPISLRETITRKTYNTFIQPHTGIRIYRDDFRVWPYGELGNDWLGLDQRRVNNPRQCLSNNQIIGIVEVSQDKNTALRDKTDREGFLETLEYRDFQSLVLSAISELEVLRRQDKDKTDKLRERKVGKKIDETIEQIEKLRQKVIRNNHSALYSGSINTIEKAHENYVSNTVQNLYVMAGIGVAALMPAHEVQVQLKDLKPLLSGLKEQVKIIGLGARLVERFDDIDRIVSILSEVSQGALELAKREHKEFSLRSVVDFSLKIKEPELKRGFISYEVIERKKINLKGYPNLVMTAIVNLIDNSIWWLQKRDEGKKIRITIRTAEDTNPIIIVSDNGPGIDPADLPFLGEAFYTRKPRGTGLGLYISKRAMEANDGRLDFGFYPNDPDYLSGANVILIFEKPEGGSKR